MTPEEKADRNEAVAMMAMLALSWAGLIGSMWVSPLVSAAASLGAARCTSAVFGGARNLIQSIGRVYWFVGENTWASRRLGVRLTQLREPEYPFRRGRGLSLFKGRTEIQVGMCRRGDEYMDALQQLDGYELDVPVTVLAQWTPPAKAGDDLTKRGWAEWRPERETVDEAS